MIRIKRLVQPAPYYFALNMADLAVTIIGVYGMGFKEGNPLAAMLIPYPFWLVTVKIIWSALFTRFMVWTSKDDRKMFIFNWIIVMWFIFVVGTWLIAITA